MKNVPQLALPLWFWIMGFIMPGPLPGQPMPQLDAFYTAMGQIRTGDIPEAMVLLDSIKGQQIGNPYFFLETGHTLLLSGESEKSIPFFLQAEHLVPGIASFRLAEAYFKLNQVGPAYQWTRINLASPYRRLFWEYDTSPFLQHQKNSQEWVLFWRKPWYSDQDWTLNELSWRLHSQRSINMEQLSPDSFQGGSLTFEFQECHIQGLLQSKALNQAIRESKKLLEDFPNNPEAHYIGYKALITGGRTKQALECLEEALRLNPFQTGWTGELGSLLVQMEMWSEAEKPLLWYSQASPTDPEAQFRVGRLFRNTNRESQSLARFDKAIQLKPNFPEAYLERGKANLLLEKMESAEGDFCMVLDLKPLDNQAWAGKGMVLIESGKIPEGCRCLERAEKLGFELFGELKNLCSNPKNQ